MHRHIKVDHGARPLLGVVGDRAGRAIGHGDQLAGGRAHLGSAQGQHHHGAFHVSHAIEADIVAHAKLLFRKDEEAGKEIRNDGLGAKAHGGRDYRRRHRRTYRRHAEIGQRSPDDEEVRRRLHDVDQRTGQCQARLGGFFVFIEAALHNADGQPADAREQNAYQQ